MYLHCGSGAELAAERGNTLRWIVALVAARSDFLWRKIGEGSALEIFSIDAIAEAGVNSPDSNRVVKIALRPQHRLALQHGSGGDRKFEEGIMTDERMQDCNYPKRADGEEDATYHG